MTDAEGENRRQAPRRFYKTQAVCQKGSDGLGDIHPAQLLNLSATGAQVLVRGSFDLNEVFYLALVNSCRQTIADVKSTIRWVEPTAPGVARIGVVFDRPLTDAEIAGVG